MYTNFGHTVLFISKRPVIIAVCFYKCKVRVAHDVCMCCAIIIVLIKCFVSLGR